MGAQRLEVDHIADAMIWTLAKKRGGFTFDEGDFDEEFARLIDAQEATEVEVVVLGPLEDLKGDGFPLLLGPDVEIREFSDSEIASRLRMGLVRSPMRSDWYHVERLLVFAFGSRCRSSWANSSMTKKSKDSLRQQRMRSTLRSSRLRPYALIGRAA